MKYLLIIGNGSIAKKHKQVIKTLTKKIKIFNIKIKNMRSSFNHIRNLISKHDIKLALVCSPTNTHLEYINFLKQSQINYLVEKPIIKDDQIKKIDFNHYKKSKISEIVGYQLRFNKILLKTKKLLVSKPIGKIRFIKISVHSFLPNWRKSKLSKSPSLSKWKGGGVLLELSHEIDYMLWIFGKPKFLQAVIDKNNYFRKNIDERVTVFFYYQDKTIQMDMSLNSRFEQREIILEGTNGSLCADILNKKITLSKSNIRKVIFKSNQSNSDMLKDQINFLLKSINSNKKINNIKHSFEIIKIISLIRKSNIKLRKIKLS